MLTICDKFIQIFTNHFCVLFLINCRESFFLRIRFTSFCVTSMPKQYFKISKIKINRTTLTRNRIATYETDFETT